MPATLLKKTLAQVFSCEFCEIFKNTHFWRTPLAAAFKNYAYMHLKQYVRQIIKTNSKTWFFFSCFMFFT